MPHRVIIGIATVAAILVVLLPLTSDLLPPTVVLAQTTCAAGQTYCSSGRYTGECRSNTATCTGGSYTACTGCVCPSGKVLCGTTCQDPKRCPDINRSTENQCAASNAASCGACAGSYTLDSGTITCVLQSPVILAPLNPQERSSAKSAINVVQGGTGLLFNLQTQNGTDSATRRQILSVDKTGLMIGYDPLLANVGVDLTGAAKNLMYGVARALGLSDDDSLLKLQVKEDGNLRDRFRIDGSGNVVAAGYVVAAGSVRGSQLCIGADCKSAWSAVAPAGVLLQALTPGAQQTGHFNVSGTGQVGSLVVSGNVIGRADVVARRLCLGEGAGAVCKESWEDVLAASACFGPVAVGVTNVRTGSLGGYIGANAVCNTSFAGSHVCSINEVLQSNACGAFGRSSIVVGTRFWISGGPPGFRAAANDCRGWTSEGSSELGRIWEYDAAGGKGFLSTCDAPYALGCCK